MNSRLAAFQGYMFSTAKRTSVSLCIASMPDTKSRA